MLGGFIFYYVGNDVEGSVESNENNAESSIESSEESYVEKTRRVMWITI